MLSLKINGEERKVDDADPSTPLLWVLRDELGLVGAKFGCGIARCGACTVLLDGAPVRSCSVPVAAAAEGEVTTIEGLADESDELTPVQQAWVDLDVAQCGYCQAGQIMAATALLARDPDPDDAAIDQAMAGNLCRCGTYTRIREAVKVAAGRAWEARKVSPAGDGGDAA